MLNVNDDTIRVYTEYGVSKNIKISFPNDSSLTPITNKKLQEESMDMTSSLSADSELSIQGCISREFKITTFDYNEDITGKDILVTLSCKDEHFKGNWSSAKKYSENDVVKFDGNYYMYVDEPDGSRSNLTGKELILRSDIVAKDDTEYRILDRPCSNLKGILLKNDIPKDVTMAVYTWFEHGPSYYIIYPSKAGEYIFPEEYPAGSTYQLAGWFVNIKYTGTDTEAFKQFIDELELYEVTYITEDKLYPSQSDFCERIYGYVDTSNVQDIVIFRGKVNSFTKQAADPRYKELIAYDKFYEWSNRSIKGWINTLNANGRGYIELYDYQGVYKTNTAYKEGQSVVEYQSDASGNQVAYYYRFKRDYIDTDYQSRSLAMVSTNGYPGSKAIKGSEYVERLGTSYYPNSVTLKKLRDDLCSYLGITQESVTLPLDDYELKIGKFDKEYTALQMLQWICNVNMVFGVINPSTGKLNYISIMNKEFDFDSRYKGIYDSGKSYSLGDVVKHTNVYGEQRYYQLMKSLPDKFPEECNKTAVEFFVSGKNTYAIAPKSWGRDCYVNFDFNDDLAREYSVEVRVFAYPVASDSKIITLRQSGRVNLWDLDSSLYRIIVSNASDEFWKTFKATIYTAKSDFNPEWDLDDEMLSPYWNKKNLIYHPGRRINLSYLYENGTAEVEDDDFTYKGINVVDMDGKNYEGETEKGWVKITFNPLFNAFTSEHNFYSQIDGNVASQKYVRLNYKPFKLSVLGLPFLEPGDFVVFDVDKWSSDDDDNPVIETETIESIILEKNLTGINALKDEYQAK